MFMFFRSKPKPMNAADAFFSLLTKDISNLDEGDYYVALNKMAMYIQDNLTAVQPATLKALKHKLSFFDARQFFWK